MEQLLIFIFVFLLILLLVELILFYRVGNLCNKILEDIEKIKKFLAHIED